MPRDDHEDNQVEYDPRTEMLVVEHDDTLTHIGPLSPETRLALVEDLLAGTGYDIAPNATLPPTRRPDRVMTPVLFGTDIIPPERIGALFENESLRNRVMFALIGVYGLRPAEVVSLTKEDVDETRTAINTTAAHGRRRRVRLHSDVADLLDEWLEERLRIMARMAVRDRPDRPVFVSLQTARGLEASSVTSLIRKAGDTIGLNQLTSADINRSCQWAMHHHPRFSRDLSLFPPMKTFMDMASAD